MAAGPALGKACGYGQRAEGHSVLKFKIIGTRKNWIVPISGNNYQKKI
jgi:hypothetical protein